MTDEEVQRELYEKRVAADPPIRISRRQIIVALLMMMILGCWALDSMHVNVVPPRMHDSAASIIDSAASHWPASGVLPTADTAVAHNPIDDSPITFGSVILLGIICTVGLFVIFFTPYRPN